MSRAGDVMAWQGLRHDLSYKTGLLVLLLTVLLALSLLFVDWLLRADTLPVKQVSFEGEFKQVTRAQLESAVLKELHSNFLVLDLDLIKTRIEALPWVHRASVHRKWPYGVHIQFSEQQLVAQWSNNVWLNQYGEAVTMQDQQVHTDLPLIHGPANSHALVLQQYRRFSDLLLPTGLRIAQLTYTDRRTWRVRTDNGMHLILGRELPEYRLQRFVDVYGAVLAPKGSIIKQVDLRYTNGFAVQWEDGSRSTPATHHYREGGGNKG